MAPFIREELQAAAGEGSVLSTRARRSHLERQHETINLFISPGAGNDQRLQIRGSDKGRVRR